MKITINSTPYEVEGPTLTHEEIIALADVPVHATVSYIGPPPKQGWDVTRCGATRPGGSVELMDGMCFEVAVTGNA